MIDNNAVVIEPDNAVQAAVIWLHGLGADGYDFQPIVPHLKLPDSLGIRFIFPHADIMPVTINGGMSMRAWYDIVEMSLDRKVDKASLIKSSERISLMVEQLIAEGIPADKILLAGFSQGGAVAYHAALCFPKALAGIVALSTYMPTSDMLEEQRNSANNGIPVWAAHGSMDEVVPLELGKRAVASLQQMGYKPEWSTYPMGHEVVMEEIDALGRWMLEKLK